MLEGHSFAPNAERHFVFRIGDRAVSAQQTPRQNDILAALPLEDYERLLPNLEFVPLPEGCTVHGAADREGYLYFITAGIVSRLYLTENNSFTELATTGSEGVVGIGSFLGGGSSVGQSLVVSAGHAYRVPANLLQDEFEHHGRLLQLLLRYTQALIAQVAQIAACNRHHSLKQQLSRWILSCLDRLPSNELAVTQELIAHMLGVRREGITVAAGKLQREGLIQYARGHIVVLDRPRLEAQACECYAVVKREYDRLLDPQNTRRNSVVHDTGHPYRMEWSHRRC
jgi:CRP-like cAMP-binding protein